MRDDQNLISVTLDGTPLGTFDTFDGGDADSDDLLYRPGGMGARLSLGGQAFTSPITVGRLYLQDRDTEIVRNAMQRAGKGVVVVSKQPLDIDGNAFGRPFIYNGTLKTVTQTKADSNATGTASVWTMVVTPQGLPG